MIQHTFTCPAGTVTYSPPAGPLGESQGTYPNKRQDLYEVVNAMLVELHRQHAEIGRLQGALDDAQSVARMAASTRVTPAMTQAATQEWDEWAPENRGTYECFEAALKAAIRARKDTE